MVLPPQELSEAVQCPATETVEAYLVLADADRHGAIREPGRASAFAVPTQQCGWCFSTAHLRAGGTRVPDAEGHPRCRDGWPHHRRAQSALGRTERSSQVLGGMTTLGLSPGAVRDFLQTKESSEAEAKPTGPNTADLSLFGIVARYVNSNLPPIVISDTSRHAWLIVKGYSRLPSAGNPKLTLYRHDDGHGPFLPVDNPGKSPISVTSTGQPPFRLSLRRSTSSAERAEAMGRWWFNTHLDAGASGAFLDAHESGCKLSVSVTITGILFAGLQARLAAPAID